MVHSCYLGGGRRGSSGEAEGTYFAGGQDSGLAVERGEQGQQDLIKGRLWGGEGGCDFQTANQREAREGEGRVEGEAVHGADPAEPAAGGTRRQPQEADALSF